MDNRETFCAHLMDINNISFMVFDEDKNDLYIVTDKQYKFSLQIYRLQMD